MLREVALTLKTKSKPKHIKSIYELDHITYQKLFRPRKDISWQKVVYLDPCSYCGTRNQKKPTQEHIIPSCNGGSSKHDNIVGACASCNLKRGQIPLLKYLLKCSKEGGLFSHVS